ncbi:thiamine diphosphokinase [Enterococcus ureilyticus]|uniref:Thiamine diphosphokinase n=1 Tax=Enterococcus ureilyticus TaxID=1131292 RepID=A0A1E5HEZ2_9ENTE|nr:thiamine diphosphokinase [Enterococcus ureilyticus]MBM7687369.1 thiamine pyrophosphokinase [Enterococcus ureilyticus]OEG23426.1 thiamine diphosphokinase [Enterococcus ureilyticus]
MNILLVAGGSPDKWPQLNAKDFDYFVGIDRGSLYIVEQGWSLDIAVGDFDSLTIEEQQLIQKHAKEVKKAQVEKDDTDTQLALALTFKKFPEAEITIIGATGGRLDHFLANLWLPLEPRFQAFVQQIKLKDQQNSISYYMPGKYRVEKEAEMNYLAYCCLTPVEQLTLLDSKYTLDHVDVVVPTSYASNEFVGTTATFSFASGMVAVIQSTDK